MVNKPDIKLILFDIGNVLVNYDSTQLCNNLIQFCDQTRYKQQDIYDYLYNFRSFIRLELGEITIDDLYKDIKQRFEMNIDLYNFCTTWVKELKPDLEMKSMVSLLSEHYTLGIISNIDPVRLRYISEQGMIEFGRFKYSFPSYIMGMVKPDIRISDYVAERILCNRKKNVLFIDDKDVNVRSMQAGGIKSIQYSNPAKLRSDLKEMGIEL